jgi:hypothetical protein
MLETTKKLELFIIFQPPEFASNHSTKKIGYKIFYFQTSMKYEVGNL